MTDYVIPSEILHKEIFRKHPERLMWLVRLLDISDENGEFYMSYGETAKAIGTTKDCARRFLNEFTTCRHDSDTALTRFAICKPNSYATSRHDVDTALTRNDNENKKPKSRSNAAPKEYTLLHKVRMVFEEFVQKNYGEAYYWKPKDAAACKKLIEEIKFSRVNRQNPLPVDDDGIIEGFKGYINSINDKWILEHFSMTQLASSFQQIRQQLSIQNGNSNITIKSAGERAKDSVIQSQKQSIVDKAAEYQRRWEQSQGT